jgi:hypothetical protein
VLDPVGKLTTETSLFLQYKLKARDVEMNNEGKDIFPVTKTSFVILMFSIGAVNGIRPKVSEVLHENNRLLLLENVLL